MSNLFGSLNLQILGKPLNFLRTVVSFQRDPLSFLIGDSPEPNIRQFMKNDFKIYVSPKVQ